jgi:hypothetical protein
MALTVMRLDPAAMLAAVIQAFNGDEAPLSAVLEALLA